MNLKKSIEELERGTRQNRSTNNQRLRAALLLGIEALKRVEHTRHEAPEFVIPLLPGETED